MRVWLSNFGYNLDGTFPTLEAAIAAGKKACFEFSVWDGDTRLYSWSPLYGCSFRAERVVR